MKARAGPAELNDATVAVIAAAATAGETLSVGLEELRRLTGADRADAGFVTSRRDTYRPAAFATGAGVAPAVFAVPASEPMLMSVLAEDHAVAVSDMAADVAPGPVQDAMAAVGTRSVIVRRLEHSGAVFGLVCLDWVGAPHVADRHELGLIDAFVGRVLAPILALSGAAPGAPGPGAPPARLTPAELEVVDLAAQGLSYREIATATGKSIHTIDHQLLKARRRLGARNTAELIRMTIAPPSAGGLGPVGRWGRRQRAARGASPRTDGGNPPLIEAVAVDQTWAPGTRRRTWP